MPKRKTIKTINKKTKKNKKMVDLKPEKLVYAQRKRKKKKKKKKCLF